MASELENQVAPQIRNASSEALQRVYQLIDDEFLRRRLEESMPKSIRTRYPEGALQVLDIRGKEAMTVVFPGTPKAVDIKYKVESWTKHGAMVENVDISIGYKSDPGRLSWSLGLYADNEESRDSDGWSTVRKIISEVDPEGKGKEGVEVIMWLLRALREPGSSGGEDFFEEDLTEALMHGEDAEDEDL